MAKVYKSICNELDALMLQMFHLSEKEIKYKLEIENIMNNGFVNIAKARYIMGSKCVSTLQLPTENSSELKPISTVVRVKSYNHWVYKVNRQNMCQSSKDCLKGDGNIGGSEVRKRKGKDVQLIQDEKYQELKTEMTDRTPSSDSDSSVSSIADPIRMFGILVPQTLKTAQQYFVDVLAIVGKCATIQSEMDTCMQRFLHLTEVKRLIEQSVKTRDVNLFVDPEYWTPSKMSTESSETSVSEKDKFPAEEVAGEDSRLFVEDYNDNEQDNYECDQESCYSSQAFANESIKNLVSDLGETAVS